MIGYWLLDRGNRLIVSLIRHIVGWWVITFAIALTIARLTSGGRDMTTTESIMSAVAPVVLAGVAWLILRKWRRGVASVEATNTPTVLSSAS